MTIARPTTKTIISTTQFGIPVVDTVNALSEPAWQNIPLAAGITGSPSDWPVPQYAIAGQWLKLRGLAYNSTGASITAIFVIGTVPVTIPFASLATISNSGGTTFRCDFMKDGRIRVHCNTTTLVWPNAGYLSLDQMPPIPLN